MITALNIEDNIEMLYKSFQKAFNMKEYKQEDFDIFLNDILEVDYSSEEAKKSLKFFDFQLFVFLNFFYNNNVKIDKDARNRFMQFFQILSELSIVHYIKLSPISKEELSF